MTSTLQIAQMSREEKLLAMETIWADLSKAEDEVDSPAWHGEVLRETESRVAAGQERIADWETAKLELRIKDKSAEWRLFCRADKDAVLLLRVLSKKTRETPQTVIDLCVARLKAFDARMRE